MKQRLLYKARKLIFSRFLTVNKQHCRHCIADYIEYLEQELVVCTQVPPEENANQNALTKFIKLIDHAYP